MTSITVLFTIIFLTFYLFLSFKTISVRKKSQVAFGTGGNEELLRATRAHSNFYEYTVFFILSCILAEYLGAEWVYILIVNTLFLFGRIFHAISMYKNILRYRQIGMLLTFGCYMANISYMTYLYFFFFLGLE
jgi:uncharacterized membrane protein YecN with MAPEG domain